MAVSALGSVIPKAKLAKGALGGQENGIHRWEGSHQVRGIQKASVAQEGWVMNWGRTWKGGDGGPKREGTETSSPK